VIARDLMTYNPVTVAADASVAEAVEILRELDIRHLPVVQGGVLVGILSDRDLRQIDEQLLSSMNAPGAASLRRTTAVARIMSSDVIAVHPDTEVTEVIGILIETKIGAVPVIERASRELVGIVSYIDVLRAVQDMVED
jgi:acetoin utilization protein AcuB